MLVMTLSSRFPSAWFSFSSNTAPQLRLERTLYITDAYSGLYPSTPQVFLSGDTDVIKSKENVLYMSNHQSNGKTWSWNHPGWAYIPPLCLPAVDWVLCNMLAIRQGSVGHLRYVMKNSLRMVPLYGFTFYQHGCIYVNRGNFKQNKMEDSLKYLQNKKIPVRFSQKTRKKFSRYFKFRISCWQSWVVLFPEGTFWDPLEPWLIEKSTKYALSMGIKPYNHHLTPRSRAAFLALQHLRCKLDAIYDITSVYAGSSDDNGNRLTAPGLLGGWYSFSYLPASC